MYQHQSVGLSQLEGESTNAEDNEATMIQYHVLKLSKPF